MKRFTGLLIVLSLILTSCNGQPKPERKANAGNKSVGGPFENSNWTYLKMPGDINAADTSPAWHGKGQRMLLTGTVYKPDGKTPAAGVLLYYYHTNTEGRYMHDPQQKRSMAPNNLGQTHGYIRGWVRTDAAGRYFIYTVRPGTYPTRDEPAHIHLTVKENDINEYYIDDVVFDDDVLLTKERRNRLENRCGSGIVSLVAKGDLQTGKRDIILGLNIPEYPARPARKTF